MEDSQGLKPTTASQRIAELDALRGFAILGILFMNIEYFTNAMSSLFLGAGPVYTGIDLIADRFTSIFVEGKFWVMFSLLFGMGFAVMQSRMLDSTRGFGKFYFKRMFILLIFGALHSILLWTGDILFPYAVTGIFLLLFRKTPITRLWKYALFFFSLIVVLTLLGAASDPNAPPDEFTLYLKKQLELANSVYPHGTYLEVSKQRLGEFAINVSMLIMYVPYFLGVFLFGNWLFKIGLFSNLETHKKILKKVFIIGLLVGVALSIPSAIALENSNLMQPTNSLEAYMAGLDAIASFILCMAYIAGFLLLAMRNTFNVRTVLAPVGRMALSNYILQSLVFSTLFYGYGFGLWGEISRAALIPLVLGFYIFQCALSHWWMKSHRYGPLEWVWRRLSYGKIL